MFLKRLARRATPLILLMTLVIASASTLRSLQTETNRDSKLFLYNQDRPFDLKETSAEEESGVIVRDLNYAPYAPRHARIKAYLVKPQRSGRFAGVLFFHWLGESKSDRTQFLEEAKTLARKGVVSLLIQGFFPWLEPPAEGQADRQQVIDQTIEVRRALDLLLMHPEVDPKRIGYVGHDYGAMYGSIVAGLDKRVRSYVLIAGMGNFGDWSLKYWPATGAKGAEVYRQAMQEVDPIRYISRAAPAKLLFQFAEKDIYISKSVADEFLAAASSPKEVKWYDAKHELDIEIARADRAEWLTQQLGLPKQTADSSAPSGGGVTEVLAVIKTLAEAGMKRDVATIARFHADDFFHTNADGSMMNKSEVLESYKAARQGTIESDEYDQERVQMYGDVAIVNCRVTLQGHGSDGQQFRTPFRVTYIMKKRNGDWQLVASHASVMK